MRYMIIVIMFALMMSGIGKAVTASTDIPKEGVQVMVRIYDMPMNDGTTDTVLAYGMLMNYPDQWRLGIIDVFALAEELMFFGNAQLLAATGINAHKTKVKGPIGDGTYLIRMGGRILPAEGSSEYPMGISCTFSHDVPDELYDELSKIPQHPHVAKVDTELRMLGQRR